MKLLHLLYESKGDYFGIGGVGIRAYEIYRRLRDSHDITLVCKRYPGAVDGHKEGLKHVFAGSESRSLTKTLLSYALHASRFVREHGEEFDVVVEEFSPAIPTFLHTFRKRPLVLQIQGYTGPEYFKKYNIFYSSILYILERVRPLFYENFIIVSDITGKRYRLDHNKHKIELIPNGIPEELLSCEPVESDYILYLGRIDIHHKGLDILLNAYSEFYGSFPDVRLVIAGDGRDREKFAGAVGGLPHEVRMNIELKGWVEGREKIALLRNALAVVMPSRYESQAIVALEAMACAKALVVSKIPEFDFVGVRGAGVTFEPGNPQALAAALKGLIERDGIKETGLNGRRWAGNYTWDKIAIRYEEYLKKVVEQTGP